MMLTTITEPLTTVVIYLPQEVEAALLAHGCTIVRRRMLAFHHRCTVILPPQTRVLAEGPNPFPLRLAQVQLPDGYHPWYVQLSLEGPGLFYCPSQRPAPSAEGNQHQSTHQEQGAGAWLMSTQEIHMVMTRIGHSICLTPLSLHPSPEEKRIWDDLNAILLDLLDLRDQQHPQPDAIPVYFSLERLILLEEVLHLHLACSIEAQSLLTAFEHLLVHLYAVVAQQGSLAI
jgi:hypothetical protein